MKKLQKTKLSTSNKKPNRSRETSPTLTLASLQMLSNKNIRTLMPRKSSIKPKIGPEKRWMSTDKNLNSRTVGTILKSHLSLTGTKWMRTWKGLTLRNLRSMVRSIVRRLRNSWMINNRRWIKIRITPGGRKVKINKTGINLSFSSISSLSILMIKRSFWITWSISLVV